MLARSMPGLASSLFSLSYLEIHMPARGEMNIGSSDDIFKIYLSYEDLEGNSMRVCIIFSH